MNVKLEKYEIEKTDEKKTIYKQERLVGVCGSEKGEEGTEGKGGGEFRR